MAAEKSTSWRKIRYGWRKNPLWLEEKILPPMAEQPLMGSGKIHNGWRKNPPVLAEILALAEKLVLWFVTIFLENSAAGRLWSCGTPSLAWNYLESFLQCGFCKFFNIATSSFQTVRCLD